MAVKSEALVKFTATYQLPPATVSAHVTKAVVRRKYGTGDLFCCRGERFSCWCCTIWPVERKSATCLRQNAGHGCCHFCSRSMRSCAGHSNDHEPCVKYLNSSASLLAAQCDRTGRHANLQHAIRLIPMQVMLDIHRRLCLNRKRHQTQPQKACRVSISLLRCIFRHLCWISLMKPR